MSVLRNKNYEPCPGCTQAVTTPFDNTFTPRRYSHRNDATRGLMTSDSDTVYTFYAHTLKVQKEYDV